MEVEIDKLSISLEDFYPHPNLLDFKAINIENSVTDNSSPHCGHDEPINGDSHYTCSLLTWKI